MTNLLIESELHSFMWTLPVGPRGLLKLGSVEDESRFRERIMAELASESSLSSDRLLAFSSRLVVEPLVLRLLLDSGGGVGLKIFVILSVSCVPV